MNRYRFTQNEFDRRANYWGCGGRVPERHELFNPTRQEETWPDDRRHFCYTKPYNFYDTQRRFVSITPSVDSSPPTDNPKRTNARASSVKRDRKLSPDQHVYINNRKVRKKSAPSLLVNIDTKNPYNRRVSMPEFKDQRFYNSEQKNPGIGYGPNRRRSRSLTPAESRGRSRKDHFPRTSCPMEMSHCGSERHITRNLRSPKNYVPPKAVILSPKRFPKPTPGRNLDCKYECLCFNERSWTCSNIAVVKSFVSTATYHEVMALMGVVRCLIRERYSTNNSNCTKQYKGNNSNFDCSQTDDQEVSEDISSMPTTSRCDKQYCIQHENYSRAVPNQIQTGKSVSFGNDLRKGRQTHLEAGNAIEFNNRLPSNDAGFGKIYSSPIDANIFTGPDSNQKKYLRDKAQVNSVVKIKEPNKRASKKDTPLRPQRSWSGVITDCKDFLKQSSENRCIEKYNFNSKMAETSKSNKKDKNPNKPCSDVSSSNNENLAFSESISSSLFNPHINLAPSNRPWKTQLHSVGDDMGNKFYLSESSYDQLCQYINPTELRTRSKKMVFAQGRDFDDCVNDDDDDDDDENDGHKINLNASSLTYCIEDGESRMDTETFSVRDEQQSSLSKTASVKLVRATSSNSKTVESSKNDGDDPVPIRLLDITQSTQDLLDKASVRIKEVGNLLDKVSVEEDRNGVKNDEPTRSEDEKAQKSLQSLFEKMRFPIELSTKNQTDSKNDNDEVQEDDILAADNSCIIGLSDIELLKKEVNNISKQIEQDNNTDVTNTKQAVSSNSRNGMGVLIRENTWIKGESGFRRNHEDGKDHRSKIKAKEELITSSRTSLTSLDTSSSAGEGEGNKNPKVNKSHKLDNRSLGGMEGCKEHTDKESSKNVTRQQINKLETNLNYLKSSPLLVKCYQSCSPLPKKTQLHIQTL